MHEWGRGKGRSATCKDFIVLHVAPFPSLTVCCSCSRKAIEVGLSFASCLDMCVPWAALGLGATKSLWDANEEQIKVNGNVLLFLLSSGGSLGKACLSIRSKEWLTVLACFMVLRFVVSRRE